MPDKLRAMVKHRAERKRHAPIAMVMTALVAVALVGYLLVFWPFGAPPTAASETLGASDRQAVKTETRIRGLKRLVVYGHSMPDGGGASDVRLGYAEVAEDLTKLKLDNRSVGGTIASTTANTVAEYPAAGPRDAVVIHTGMNDIFREGEGAVELGRAAIQRILYATAKAKQRVLVLECQPSDWMDTPPAQDLQTAYDAWNTMLREEASGQPGVNVLDTCESWDPAAYTDSPQYHPNDDGHALIAEELNELLRSS